MDIHRRSAKSSPSTTPQGGGGFHHLSHGHGHEIHQKNPSSSAVDHRSSSPAPKASDALPLPLYLTNAIFFTLFFTVAYYLLHRWRDKIRNSTPLHVVTLSEIAAIVSLMASFIYLLGFFGIDFVQSFIARASHDAWDLDDASDSHCHHHDFAIDQQTLKLLEPEPFISSISSEEDKAIINSVIDGTVPSYSLESKLGDCKRAASLRRQALQRMTGRSLQGLPLDGFDYDSILGQCCEMPIGYVQIPVGIAGPLSLDGYEYSVPMATTEGCLVASTNRGCKAIFASGGATSTLLRDGMTRAPVVRFASAKRASELKFFLEDPVNFETLALIFNRSSRFARLQKIQCSLAGKNLYMRFSCSTGDAMGMNMVSKGVQNVLDFLQNDFPDMDVIGISGNYCSDKKPAAVNWIEGRGNNIVSAIFIATGQDPAQNVESSHCLTMMEAVNDGRDLHISVTMPSIEVGTVGGGTQLASQSACLNLLGVKGASRESPGSNARLLATIVAGSVLAGELSLMSAIAAGQLVKSHMKYNRSRKDVSQVAY
ncbi:3-hydroxy-3-methylglutaryl coenzyme A reductase [Quillaja saponaria]|uniref:hydroxymethylglutaryl-CoA reductase (NADPH) n=1 Tax=Quillaja saponaria TaxID=32244 RepID=A0AAD7LZ52_QUISA|nr:3-hydroxy-3-methylglutaryl coenzyme A reductase [Quillaja saponaria]